MSDTDAIYRLLQREGSRGVHTLDLRREGFSGNPSQRKADIEKKYGVQIHAERERRGKRNGSRYRLVGVGAGSWDNSHRGTYAPTACLDASVDSDAKPAGVPTSGPRAAGCTLPSAAPPCPQSVPEAQLQRGRDRQVRGAGSDEPAGHAGYQQAHINRASSEELARRNTQPARLFEDSPKKTASPYDETWVDAA